ncbi:MAG: hypothetical protein J6J00_01120 [Treponema sp.]|nr:hypothetical protein [Treponema sp.]
MKNVKKLHCGFVALMAVFALAFAGCAQSADDEDNAALENPADASSGTDASADGTDSTDASGVKVLKAGDSVTVNVGESVTVKAEGKTAAEFTQSGLTITHKGDGVFEISAAATMSEASVNVNFNDGTDSDDGIDITLYVYDPNYTLNITLDSVVAESAASISIYAEGKEDDETEATLKQTVNATYTAGATSASAKLAKDKANSYKYFNNIVVTVKDSDGNEIDVETNPVYFCYTDTAFTGITVSEAVAEKTFTINFQGFTIPGGSVTGLKYSTAWASSSSEWSEDSIVTPTVTVAADGASATFTVASTSEFYIDWTAVVVKDSEGNTISISAGNTEANQWYSYSGKVWSNTLTHVSGEYVNLCNAQAWSNSDSGSENVFISVLDASAFTSLNISTLRVRITLSTGSWANASSAAAWADATYANTSWSDDANAHEVIITSSDFISALKTNGLYVATSAGSAGTVTVDYIAQ